MSTDNKLWDESELEFVNCDYCGSNKTLSICTRPDGLHVVECIRCGLAYLNPRPNQAAISRLYSKNYFKKENNTIPTHIGYADYFRIFNERTLFPELDFLELYQPLQGKDIFEVGCATGCALAEAKRRGANVTGLELSQYAVEEARKKEIEVIAGDLASRIQDLKTYDIVMAFEVIEHVQKPNKFLGMMARLVRSGGYLMVSTPNYRCALRYGEKWLGFQTSFEHLYFFSDEVLFRIGRSMNLSLVSWYTVGMGSPSPDIDRNEIDIAVEKVKNKLRKVPGVVSLWHFCKSILLGSQLKPYDLFGQGHTLVALFKKKTNEY